MENTKVQNKKFRASKWIFLFFAVASNAFLIVYSALPKATADQWNKTFTNFFSGIVNSITQKEVKIVELKDINLSFSGDKYNDITGYELNEIPLGSAKEICCNFYPKNASDQTVEFVADDPEIISFSQSGSKSFIIGMKVGTTTIEAINKKTGLTSYIDVTVVNTVAPAEYEISLQDIEIPLNEQETVIFDIDGGVLGHNELINFRYYDIRKLSFVSLNPDIAIIDNYGVIHPISIGDAAFTISNDSISKTINASIVNGGPAVTYSKLSIIGPEACYGNDMINDQNGGNNHYQLDIYDSDIKLNPEDFIWSSSNELLAKVDSHGILRGFRKSTTTDEFVTITAISKLNGATANISVTVKEQLPNKMNTKIVFNKSEVWNPTEYTACVGDNVTIEIYYSPSISKKDVEASSSNEEVVKLSNEGSTLKLIMESEGNSIISIKSVVNPKLSTSITFTVLKAGAINTDDIDGVNYRLRKIIGHASLFAISQLFTIITFYMFLYKKKMWFFITLSLSVSLLVSAISEIIQSQIPGRFGTVSDVFINFVGAVIGAVLFLIPFFIKHFKKSK